jgi:hypothetical protein
MFIYLFMFESHGILHVLNCHYAFFSDAIVATFFCSDPF